VVIGEAEERPEQELPGLNRQQRRRQEPAPAVEHPPPDAVDRERGQRGENRRQPGRDPLDRRRRRRAEPGDERERRHQVVEQRRHSDLGAAGVERVGVERHPVREVGDQVVDQPQVVPGVVTLDRDLAAAEDVAERHPAADQERRVDDGREPPGVGPARRRGGGVLARSGHRKGGLV